MLDLITLTVAFAAQLALAVSICAVIGWAFTEPDTRKDDQHGTD